MIKPPFETGQLVVAKHTTIGVKEGEIYEVEACISSPCACSWWMVKVKTPWLPIVSICYACEIVFSNTPGLYLHHSWYAAVEPMEVGGIVLNMPV